MDRKEPRLYRRGGVFWAKFYVPTEQGDVLVRHSLKTRDEKEAKRKLVEIAHKGNEGRMLPPSKTFLFSVIEEYKKYHEQRVTYNTWRHDAEYLKQFEKWLSGRRVVRLEQVTGRLVLDYLTAKTEDRGWKPKTWNRALGVVRGLFKYALKYCGFVSKDPRHDNPAKAIEPRKVPRPVIRYLTREQIIGQLDALKRHPEMQAIVATFIFAGLRREELTWLTVHDVDFETMNIRITAKEIDGKSWRAKTNSDRRVPISSDLLRFLRPYAGYRRQLHSRLVAAGRTRGRVVPSPAETIWFFPTPLGCRWDPNNLSSALANLQRKKKQGFTDGGKLRLWSNLVYRHTFATQLAARGTTLDKLAKLMGNSVAICERHYAAFVTADMKDEVEMGIYAGERPRPSTPGVEQVLQLPVRRHG